MRIYFYDADFRYSGSRLLNEGETAPENTTFIDPNLPASDGYMAHLIDRVWIVEPLPYEPPDIPEPPTEPEV